MLQCCCAGGVFREWHRAEETEEVDEPPPAEAWVRSQFCGAREGMPRTTLGHKTKLCQRASPIAAQKSEDPKPSSGVAARLTFHSLTWLRRMVSKVVRMQRTHDAFQGQGLGIR